MLDTAVYHCQQAAEKSLKAYLTLKDCPFQKIHVLSVLVEQCMVHDPDFNQLRDIADELTPYATAFRYPGDVLEPEFTEVEEAINSASFVVGFVLEKMPKEVKDGLGRGC